MLVTLGELRSSEEQGAFSELVNDFAERRKMNFVQESFD